MLKLPLTNKGVLGIKPDKEYDYRETDIKKGDILFLYTDGITEAHSRQRELYGSERLERFLLSCIRENVQELVADVVEDVRKFMEGAAQSDDITILAIAKEV